MGKKFDAADKNRKPRMELGMMMPVIVSCGILLVAVIILVAFLFHPIW